MNLTMEAIGTGLQSRRPEFALPVDFENQATRGDFRLVSLAPKPMRTFHLHNTRSTFHIPWTSFYCCFVSAFADPPLVPIIRDYLKLNVTTTDIGNEWIASLSGAVFARLVMGTASDLFGPQIASAALLFLTSPAVYFCTSNGSSPIPFESFLLVRRFFTGFSLSTFVSVTKYWMSTIISAHFVATGNSISVGSGDLGGGESELQLPLIFSLIQNIGSNHCVIFPFLFFFAFFLTDSSWGQGHGGEA